MNNKQVTILVVAVDIGTTYSRFAYLFKSKRLTLFDAKPVLWPNGQDKAPTVVLFNKNRVFDSFGYEAELKYSELVSEGEHEDWYFFQRFKLKLNERMDTEDTNLSDAFGKTMPASTVLAAVIKAMRVRMLYVFEKNSTFIGGIDILWVFNVPVRWSDFAHRLLKKASHEAGIPDNKMMIVLDPVAASLFYDTTLSEEAITLKYMVLDVGGGTIDITVLEKQYDGSITAVYHSSSKNASLLGGLWLMLGEIVGQETLKSLQKDNMIEYIQMERDFEIKTQDIYDTVTFKAPAILCKIHSNEQLNKCHYLEKMYPKSGKFEVFCGKIRIDGGLFKEHLNVSVVKIGSLLNRAFEQPAVVGTSVCLTVGALSESDYLINSLKQKFPTLKFVSNKTAQFANVVGTAMSGHRPNTVSCSIHNTVTDLPDSEQRHYSSHDTREIQGKSRTENIVPYQSPFSPNTESADKGILDLDKAIDSCICRSGKTGVLSEQRLNNLKQQQCKAFEFLNARFQQPLKEKQKQCSEHRSRFEEMQQLTGGFISKQTQLEEDVLTSRTDKDGFKERAADFQRKYRPLLAEDTKLKQENQRIDENNQRLSQDNLRAQFQVDQSSEIISRLQNKLDALEKDRKLKETLEEQLRCKINSLRTSVQEGYETLAKLQTRNEDLKSRAVESKKKYRTIQAEVTKLKQENQRIDKNNRRLSLDNTNARVQVAQSSKTISSLQKELDALKQDRKLKETLEEQLKYEIHSPRASVEEGQVTLAKRMTENENLKSRLRESETRYTQMETRYMQAESKVDEKLHLLQQIGLTVSRHAEMELGFKQQISKLREENKTLQQRERELLAQIEMITGNGEKKRRDNNENDVSNTKDSSDTENDDEVSGRIGEICNLSDPNRAARLSERFSDLFHEDWPIAVEYLTKSSFTQKEAVGCLLSLLQMCFNSCKKASKAQIQILTRALLQPVGTLSDLASNTAQSVQLSAKDLTEVDNRNNHALLQLRRAIATHPSVVQRIKEECAKEVTASSTLEHCQQWTQITFESCTPFIMKCAELCWLMCLLDPPLEMEFDFKQGEEINPEVYTLHSTFGQTADFLVWPPLYNSETGNIVAQGVAEAFTP